MNILTVNVQKKLAKLVLPSRSNCKCSFQEIGRQEFSNYFKTTILKEIFEKLILMSRLCLSLKDLRRWNLPTFSFFPIHFRCLLVFETEDVEKIIRARFSPKGIVQRIEKARAGEPLLLDSSYNFIQLFLQGKFIDVLVF